MEFEKLQEIIAEVLNVDPEEITMNTTFVDDLGADSLDVFQIIMGIEEEFDIEIPTEEAEKIATVGDAVEADQERTELIQCLLKSYREVCQAKGLGGLPKGRIATPSFQRERMSDSWLTGTNSNDCRNQSTAGQAGRWKYTEYTSNELEKRIGYSFQDKKLLDSRPDYTVRTPTSTIWDKTALQRAPGIP